MIRAGWSWAGNPVPTRARPPNSSAEGIGMGVSESTRRLVHLK
jgi:hypothetical protein